MAVAYDHGQQIIEIMGYAAGQAAHGLKFLSLPQLLLETAALRHITNDGVNAPVLEPANAGLHLEKRPAMPKQAPLVSNYPPGAQVIQGYRVAELVWVRDEIPHIQFQKLFAGITQHLEQLGIHLQIIALLVANRDSV